MYPVIKYCANVDHTHYITFTGQNNNHCHGLDLDDKDSVETSDSNTFLINKIIRLVTSISIRYFKVPSNVYDWARLIPYLHSLSLSANYRHSSAIQFSLGRCQIWNLNLWFSPLNSSRGYLDIVKPFQLHLNAIFVTCYNL